MRLERALTEVARVRHGIDQFEEVAASPGTDPPQGLRQVSEERRRARRLEHDSVVERTLQELVEVARRATGALSVVYLSVDREQDLAFVKAGDGPETLVREATLALSEDPIAFVLDRKISFYATDFERLLGALPWHRPPTRVGTLLAVPVLVGDVVLGVLIADRAEIQGFTGSEPELLESFARLVAEDLSRTRAAVSSAEQTVELGALATVSAQLAEQVERRGVYRLLLKSAQELVSFESAAILRTDDAETRYVVEAATGWAREFKGREVALAERTWSAWVLRSAQEPYVLDDLAEAETRMPLIVLDEGGGRAESLLAVPLRSANTSLGALILTGRRGSFDATANRVLKILASQTAAVLKTIWLVEQRTELAVRDGLTGLYNRRSFNDSLARSIAREARSGGRLALLLFDLDHFKKINDSHGHPAGDEALRRASRILEASLRRGDLAARYGGEEFTAILPGADEEGGVRQAERVRLAIAKEPLLFEGARIEMRASFGVAVWPEAGGDAQALVDAADRALYAAKEGGRNRVVAASALARAAIEAEKPPG
jgi:diguanylate cyclase (GGDEF)-like protein